MSPSSNLKKAFTKTVYILKASKPLLTQISKQFFFLNLYIPEIEEVKVLQNLHLQKPTCLFTYGEKINEKLVDGFIKHLVEREYQWHDE